MPYLGAGEAVHGRYKMDEGEEKEDILKELVLLSEMRKLHEWTVLRQEEVEELEKGGADSEASGPTAEQPPA